MPIVGAVMDNGPAVIFEPVWPAAEPSVSESVSVEEGASEPVVVPQLPAWNCRVSEPLVNKLTLLEVFESLRK